MTSSRHLDLNWLYARTVFWPTWTWNLLLGRVWKRRNWWDEIEPGVFLGARPLKKDLPILFKLGVRGIVNMCEEFPGFLADYKNRGIEQLWLPTVDFTHPSLADVERGVDFIERIRLRGDAVYIHCKAGRGRSATVLVCWLIRKFQISAEAAQNRISDKRPHVNSRLLQRPVVKEFERKWLRGG